MGTTSLPTTMLDMSRASLEYVCKHVTSPNIARRFGHKLEQSTENRGTNQVSNVYQYQSGRYIQEVPSIATVSTNYHLGGASYGQGVASYGQRVASYGQSSYLCRSSRSSSRDSYEVTAPTTTITVPRAKTEIPGIFSFHHNSAKTYLTTFK